MLGAACERRGIDLTRVDVFLDALSTPLPLLTTETFGLGGKHLRVTGKLFKDIIYLYVFMCINEWW